MNETPPLTPTPEPTPAQEPAPAQTPPQAPQPPNGYDATLETHKNKSFFYGILSLFTFLWLSPVGLVFGIVGLLQTNKARKRSVELQENPPRTFMPQFVMNLVGIIGSVVMMLIFAITLISGASTIGPVFEATMKSTAEYPKAVATLEAAKKDFTASEVVEYGPFDLKVRTVESPYVLNSEEAVTFPARIESLRNNKQESQYNAYKQNLTDAEIVYTKFTIDTTYNADRGASYDMLSMSNRSWGMGLARAELDGARCLGTSPNEKVLEKYNSKSREGYKDATSITYLCIGSTPNPEKITLEVTAFTKVSPLVGTEGMPTKRITYSVQL